MELIELLFKWPDTTRRRVQDLLYNPMQVIN
jgi:hypothetical protein